MTRMPADMPPEDIPQQAWIDLVESFRQKYGSTYRRWILMAMAEAMLLDEEET